MWSKPLIPARAGLRHEMLLFIEDNHSAVYREFKNIQEKKKNHSETSSQTTTILYYCKVIVVNKHIQFGTRIRKSESCV